MKPPWRRPAFTLVLEQSGIWVIEEGGLKVHGPDVTLLFLHNLPRACRKSKIEGVERTSGPPEACVWNEGNIVSDVDYVSCK